MIHWPSFSVILQGPLNRNESNLLRQLKVLEDLGVEIILSYWTNDDDRFILDLPLYKKSAIKIIKQNPIHKPFLGINNNLPSQIQSTRKGLQLATRLFTIKSRSDELYSNLEPIAEGVIRNYKKLVCSNIFFIPPEEGKLNTYWHCGDHIFSGETSHLRKMFNQAWLNLDNFNKSQLSIEGYLFKSFLEGNEIPTIYRKEVSDFEKARVELKYNVVCIDINKLAPYSWSCAGNYYSDDSYLYNNGFNKSIKSVEEL